MQSDVVSLCIGIFLGVTETALSCLIWKRAVDLDLRQRKIKAMIVLFVILSAFLSTSVIKRQDYPFYYMVSFLSLYVVLVSASYIDYKKHIIPNVLIIAGCMVRLLSLITELILSPDTVGMTCLRSFTGLIISFLFFFILMLLTRKGIGAGDVKLYSYIGFCVGIFETYYILFYSVLIAAIFGAYFVLIKKKSKGYEMSFAPFTLAAFYIVYFTFALSGQ